SVFRLRLPRVAPSAPRAPASAPAAAPPPSSPEGPGVAPAVPRGTAARGALADDRATIGESGGSGRILLVIEDDPMFARVLYDLAHEIGFQCLLASAADEGMELAMNFELAAVILD